VVITQEQIRERGYTSLLDIFQDLPEVKVDFGVDPRWMNDVTIRGIRGMEKFVILLDGVRISSPTNDAVAVMENYPVHMAKQVEVVFGPASALYGADAFSGVVNIISRRDDSEQSRGGAMALGGDNASATGNFWLQHRLAPRASLRLSGQFFRDDQPPLEEHYPEFDGLEQTLLLNQFSTVLGPQSSRAKVEPFVGRAISAHALHAALELGDFSLSYFGNSSRTPSTQAVDPNNAVYNQAAFFGHAINMGSLAHQRSSDRLAHKAILTFSRYDLDPRSVFWNVWTDMEPAYLFAYGWMAKAEELVSYTPSPRWELTAGLTYETFESMPRTNDIEQPVMSPDDPAIIVNTITPLTPEGIDADLIRVNYSNFGGLAQARFSPSERVSLTLGTRLDSDTRFGATLNPRLGVVVTPNDRLSLKALYGRAFLAPAPQYMYDRYGTFFPFEGTLASAFFQMPNPELAPQTVNTLELDGSLLLNPKLSVALQGYFSDVRGLISSVVESDRVQELYPDHTYEGFPVFTIQIYDNLGEAQIYGLTLRAQYAATLSARQSLSAYLAASFIGGSIDIDEGGPLPARDLPGTSTLTLKAGATWRVGKASLSPRVIWMSGQRAINALAVLPDDPTRYQQLDGYALVNLFAGYDIGKGGQAFVRVTNLLNQKYHNVNLGAAPLGLGGSSAAAEFAGGMPQYLLRASLGFRFDF